MPLLVHGEVIDPTADIFDKERLFIDTVLRPLITRFPSLRVVMEHITTEEAALFVGEEMKDNPNICATITAHHLLYNRNDLFKGGVCPHMFCLPILKREKHRLALLKAATSGMSIIPHLYDRLMLDSTVSAISCLVHCHQIKLIQ
jgi:dihydroorotase